MSVVVVTSDPVMFGAVGDALEARGHDVLRLPSPSKLDSAPLAEVEVIYAPGGVRIGAELMDRAPRLMGLVSPFTGVEGFDRAAASARGVLIGNGQIDENVESMAEATVMLLLAAAYDLPASMASMKDSWPARHAGGRGRMLKAMTVGIVGYGRIAQAVIQRLMAFGCDILVYARAPRTPKPIAGRFASLDEIAEASDAVLVLASLNPDSRHLIDADFLARVKPGSILLNSARGGLVDEAALADAAKAGRVGRVVLDVFEAEPLPLDSPLRTLPGAILTPHCVGHTRETIGRMPGFALENIDRLLAGEPPIALFNPEALPAWRARQLNG